MNNKQMKLFEIILCNRPIYYVLAAMILVLLYTLSPTEQPWTAGILGLASATICFLFLPNYFVRKAQENEDTKEE